MADIQEVPTVVFQFSPGILGLYVVSHCYDEVVPIFPVGLKVSCEFHPEAPTELQSTRTMQTSHFLRASENGLKEFPENPKAW
jgi:hypothetical protein